MLRTLQTRTSPLTATLQRSLLSTSAGPSTKTTALISRLPASVTIDSLKDALKDIKNTRKLELQPGCSLHFLQQQEAEGAAAYLNSAKYRATIANATVPTVVLTDIPVSTSEEFLLNEFKDFHPLSAKVTGADGKNKPSNHVATSLYFKPSPKIPSADSVFADIKSSAALISVSDGVRVKSPAVVLHNIKQLNADQALSFLASSNPVETRVVRKSEDGFVEEVTAVYNTEQDALTALQNLKGTKVDGVRINASFRELENYAVIVRNIPPGTKKSDIMSEITGVSTTTVKTSIFESGSEPYAVISVGDKEDAQIICDLMKTATLGENKLNPTVVDFSPILYNVLTERTLEPSVWESALEGKGLHFVTSKSATDAKSVVAFQSIEDARQAQFALQQNKTAGSLGKQAFSKLSVSPSFVVDVSGLAAEKSVNNLLEDMKNNKVDATAFKTDRNAMLKFKRHRDVVPALNAIRKIAIDNTKIRGVRYAPLQKDFQSPFDKSEHGFHEKMDKAALNLLLKDSLGSDPATRYQLASNSFEIALQDARAHKDATLLIDAEDMPAPVLKEVEKLLFKHGADARNRLFDLYLQSLGESKNFKEMEGILGEIDHDDPQNWSQFRIENNEQLHKQYKHVQRLGLIAEQQKLRAMYGDFDEDCEGDEDCEYEEEEQEGDVEGEEDNDGHLVASEEGTLDFDESEYDEMTAPASGKIAKRRAKKQAIKDDAIASIFDDDDDDDEDNDDEEEDTFEEDAVTLTDDNGRVWAGYVLNQDMVQKTMPGQRIGTHRALVVVGNLRGAAGFGMGKGATSVEAVNSAFRAAVRNVIHIDLYENYGLAHDLYGKHNSCQAYIRATPQSRTTVASNFSSAVLEMFGIGSASVKMVGRRDPYSQVRALFNAISKHQNIDEYARARGKRYLTLQWARENGV